jgi:hypothetical protein
LVQKAQTSRLQNSAQTPTAECETLISTENQALADGEIKKVEPIGQEQDNSTLLTEKRKTVLERFGESLNEKISQSKKFDPVAASTTLEKLVSEASTIGADLGQAKANEFMNKVLMAANSDAQADPEAIELAVESFFEAAADSSLANPTAYQKIEQAKGAFSKLSDQTDELSDPEDSEEKTFPASQADLAPTPQTLLYQSYVSGANPGPNGRSFNQSPVGLLFSAVA